MTDHHGGGSSALESFPVDLPLAGPPARARLKALGPPTGPVFQPGDVSALVRRLTSSHDGLEILTMDLLQRGYSAEQICLDLFTPAARLLGEMWVDDTATFVDVTLGVARLQQVIHRLGDLLRVPLGAEPRGKALIGTVPGEQHTFGVTIVAEFLRRDGWMVVLVPSHLPISDVVRLAGEDWFDLVSFSAANDRCEDQLRRLLGQVRKQSRNRSFRALVGGRLVNERDGVAARVGADASAPDARAAVTAAATLI